MLLQYILVNNELKIPVTEINYKRGKIVKNLVRADPEFEAKFIKVAKIKPQLYQFWKAKMNYLANISPQYTDKYVSDAQMQASLRALMDAERQLIVKSRKIRQEAAAAAKANRVTKAITGKVPSSLTPEEDVKGEAKSSIPSIIILNRSKIKLIPQNTTLLMPEVRKYTREVLDDVWKLFVQRVNLPPNTSDDDRGSTEFGRLLRTIFREMHPGSKTIEGTMSERMGELKEPESMEIRDYNQIPILQLVHKGTKIDEQRRFQLLFEAVLLQTLLTKGLGLVQLEFPVGNLVVKSWYQGLVAPFNAGTLVLGINDILRIKAKPGKRVEIDYEL